MAVNAQPRPQEVSYDFGNHAIATVAARVTSARQDLAPVALPQEEGNRFTATLAPESVTTFVVSPHGGPPPRRD